MNIIGIDLGGTNTKTVLVNEAGDILEQQELPTVYFDSGRGWKEAIRTIVDGHAGRVGIAAPGLASQKGKAAFTIPGGRLDGLNGFDWEEYLQIPVRVVNDAHAALLGEVWRGAAQGGQNVVMITLGTGVGGAILADGRLLRGTIGRAGHLGHFCISDSDERSIVGMPGALELAIGNHNIGPRSGGRFATTHELVAAYRAGDAEAAKIWLKSVNALARAIASLINILDPEDVIVGGGIAIAGDALFDPLAAILDEIEWRPDGHRARLVPARLGGWAGAYGAAWSAIHS